jgi:hypothetical protein
MFRFSVHELEIFIAPTNDVRFKIEMRPKTRTALHAGFALLLPDCMQNWIRSTNFSKIYQHQISWNWLDGSVVATRVRADGQAGLAKLIGQRLQYLLSKAPRKIVYEF